MRCSTCGERLDDTAERCPTCGAAVTRSGPSSRSGGSVVEGPVRRCPRCGYRGDGVAYFRKPSHVALLMGVTVFTYGIGGLVYWLMRRKHRVCPNCGLGWESSSRALAPGNHRDRGAGMAEDEELPRGGGARRVLGTVFILVALLLLGIGFVEWEPGLFAVGGVTGTAGTLGLWWGLQAKKERRKAIMARLQRRVLLLAGERGGTLTVTDVAAHLNLSLNAAEKVLIAMDDGFRVRSEITDEGLLLYEFPEVKHRTRLEEGGA